MMTYFIPADEGDKGLWLSNFAAKLSIYADKYAISKDDVLDMLTGRDLFHYWADYKNKYEAYSRKLAAYKNQLCCDIRTGISAAFFPEPPHVTTPPEEILPNIFGRAAMIAGHIRSHMAFTEADGLDLGIIDEESQADEGSDP